MSAQLKKRVCIIGAGPCGMMALYHFEQMKLDKVPEVPDVICYEKQETYGGLWNYTWRTGVDQYGELCHNGMYHHLWSNGPKECLEFPDYTFEEHFGKPIPSFPPREVLRDYLEGKWKKDNRDLTKYIQFNTVVKNVEYDQNTDKFIVNRKYLPENRNEKPERFTHVIVACGIFNTPHIPSFEGLDSFPGRILHAHDFRDAEEFKGKRLLIIGASYSAEDLALQCKKYGAGDIICTYRTRPMGFKWPKGIEERPLLQKISHRTAFFQDGTSADVDVVILATGYLFSFPFLPEELRLQCALSVYSPNLYKATVWMKGGNKKLLYLGCYDQYYTFTIFELQAMWACRYIMGVLPENKATEKEMGGYEDTWRSRALKIKGDPMAEIDFQTDLMADLNENIDYSKDALKSAEYFKQWEHSKDEIATYRDKTYASLFTGRPSPAHPATFMEAFNDTLDGYVNHTLNKNA